MNLGNAPALLSETLLTFAEAVAAVPAVAGKQPALPTVYVWADKGVRVGKSRVKLECAKIGGKRVTSREALARFFEALTGQSQFQLEQTPAARKRETERKREALHRKWAKV
ncbi:DUF1580 domain-containing protein [Gemmata sp. G18]|uniref:DUF1580 domain-containing protein n=1 Tax=Gemmata palustris TaxID=2822762 RepID=A0ABS5BP36_9BACT|nr:DUF1580 domain-containing protein [Gemmata palustris]MBP3955486.1 DUF1580 domain-containing protein [Gemmata palustris]